MEWAGSRAHDGAPVLTHAHAVNATFPTGLPRIEVVHVAKHVEAYRERWRAQGWHTPRWIARQADRGRRSGLARRKAALERDARIRALAARPGWSRQRIADEVGVSRSTVKRVLPEAPSGRSPRPARQGDSPAGGPRVHSGEDRPDGGRESVCHQQDSEQEYSKCTTNQHQIVRGSRACNEVACVERGEMPRGRLPRHRRSKGEIERVKAGRWRAGRNVACAVAANRLWWLAW